MASDPHSAARRRRPEAVAARAGRQVHSGLRSPGLLVVGLLALIVGYVRCGWLSSGGGTTTGSGSLVVAGALLALVVSLVVAAPWRAPRRGVDWAMPVAAAVQVAATSASMGARGGVLAVVPGVAGLAVGAFAFGSVIAQETAVAPAVRRLLQADRAVRLPLRRRVGPARRRLRLLATGDGRTPHLRSTHTERPRVA